jgi:hypothetical protein
MQKSRSLTTLPCVQFSSISKYEYEYDIQEGSFYRGLNMGVQGGKIPFQ